ncbi:MAG: gamma-glutamyltransferase [Planctomyces sp.]|nr:gamma-glutamyltransferase [Planctomyces sp.]
MSSSPLQAAGYERGGADPFQSRSVVLARNGMVATSHPLAAQVGVDVLRAGGTAADAAIAVNAMLSVVEPMSCGLGGDLFVLYWDAGARHLFGLNASGRAPLAISREAFTERNVSQIPLTGPLSWTTPGCVDGWEELRKRFGRRPLAELLAPAIDAADQGFPVAEVIASGWQASVAELAATRESAATFLVNGRAPRFGDVFKNPSMARSLRIVAEQGPRGFYRGPIAQEICRYSAAHGGYLRLEDFDQCRAEWVDPIFTDYRGCRVYELPPNGQGLAVLQMLNILEAYDLRTMGHNTAEYLHLLIEAKKLAFADRARYYADPAYANVPVAALLSKEYAARQRRRIDPNKASADVAAGDAALAQGDTVYLCVVDRHGNCCSFIQSLFHGFGSKVVPGDVGFCLQNRGAQFSLDPNHANRLEPGKRPFHTIIPGMAFRENQPWLVFGVMGGDMQPQGHVQVLVNMIDFGMNVQQAGDAARINHLGSASPNGEPMASGGGKVAYEAGISAEVLRKLTERGHQTTRSPGNFGGYQAIVIDRDQGVLRGGSDPRKDGAAVGY